MKDKKNSRKIRISKEAVKKISKRYNPKEYLYIRKKGTAIVIVYEEKFENLNKKIYGYLAYPYPDRRIGNFFKATMNYKNFDIVNKKQAIKHYLGIETDNEEDIEKLFNGLIWFLKELSEIYKD